MPQISATADGVVARNLIYSFADISSKAVYGVLLAIIAQKVSIEKGYRPAKESAFWEPEDEAGSPGHQQDDDDDRQPVGV